MTIEENIRKLCVDLVQNGRKCPWLITLTKEDFYKLLDELGAFFRARVTEEWAMKHCSGCICKMRFMLATPAGMVTIERGTFTCAYVLG